MKRVLSAITALAWLTTPLLAAEPGLAVYVTDADEDAYVALYDGQTAVALEGCADPAAARRLLALPADITALETTLGTLEAEFAFGDHPTLPCDAAFDRDWPATEPVWADLEGSGNYYLKSPSGSDLYYAIPSRCEALKAALAIRERLQLPAVLQGLVAPPDLGEVVVLDCGRALPTDEPATPPATGEANWDLFRFSTFLSEASTGDTIYVARYRASTADAPAVYLPIWRVDGMPAADLTLRGGRIEEAALRAMRNFFGLAPEAAVEALGAEAVSAVRSMVHVDLCLSECEAYAHRHAAFLNPGIDFGLTEIGARDIAGRIGRRGHLQAVWTFAKGRDVAFADCPAVLAALGLSTPSLSDWVEAVKAGLEPGDTPVFGCPRPAADTCIRDVAEGVVPASTLFEAGADCPGASRLVVRLPASVRLAEPIALASGAFDAVTLAPAEGVTQTILTIAPAQVAGGSAGCILTSPAVLVSARDLSRLEILRIDLRRADDGRNTDVVAVEAQNSTVVLEDGAVGGIGEGHLPVARGVSLCRADFYGIGSAIEADALAVQGISARISVTGQATEPARIGGGRFGLLLSADSALYLDRTTISAVTAVVLRGATAFAARSIVDARASGASSALLLERQSTAEFALSTLRGFRCVASFADAGSEARIVLPGNDLSQDNTHLACGPGQFALLE